MKFKYIGKDLFDEDGKKVRANCYGGKKLFPGQEIELDDWLSSKALKNPNYELVQETKKELLDKSAS